MTNKTRFTKAQSIEFGDRQTFFSLATFSRSFCLRFGEYTDTYKDTKDEADKKTRHRQDDSKDKVM